MKKKYISIIRYQAPAFLWALIIFLASSIPAARIPWSFFRTLDKIIHAAIFLILGILVYRALTSENDHHIFSYKKVLLMFGIVICYGILDEIYQGFIPGRSVDFYDMLADTAGGLLAGLFVFLKGRRAPGGKSSQGLPD